MKSADLAQRWATLSHPKGTANNAYFRGLTFWHYGTVIGQLVEGVALVSRHQYSSGTSKVQGELRHAARAAGRRIFTVESCKPDHVANLEEYEAAAVAAEGRMARARNAQDHQNTADECRRMAEAYRVTFGLGR
jgi:hypothetical protein